MEIWKDIPNYQGHYQVSNLGRVKSIKQGKDFIRKPCFVSKGYLAVNLCKGSFRQSLKIHALVAMSFLNHKPDKTQKIVVDHINNIKTDNRLDNLQLISQRLNVIKDIKVGTSKFIGVCWFKESSKWMATININGKQHYLGLFNCELKAAMAYQKALQTINN
jgi:hypothetical protein